MTSKWARGEVEEYGFQEERASDSRRISARVRGQNFAAEIGVRGNDHYALCVQLERSCCGIGPISGGPIPFIPDPEPNIAEFSLFLLDHFSPWANNMSEQDEVRLHLSGSSKSRSGSNEAPPLLPSPSMVKHWQWWFMVALNIFFLLAGQTAAVLLGRLYYDQGGNSMWMATLVQTAGFPLLFVPLLLHPSSSAPKTAVFPRPPLIKITGIYFGLGLIIAADNLMYSYGLLYLPVSTYSLICATQLAFNAIFAYFFNSQKFTALILNSVVLLTFSAALLGVTEDSGSSTAIPKGKYAVGFVFTLGASVTYSLILSLMQLTFEKVIRRETFSVVFKMQIYTAFVASCAAVVGLFASGEWKGLKEEMKGYKKGEVSYVMTLVWTGVSWQVASVGVVGLIFVVSSLFSNVISTMSLPVVPIFAMVFFHDKMDGIKVIAMLIAVWGFVSYVYQHYLDDLKAKKGVSDVEEVSRSAS